jgi:tRNA pseudouridine13 synthase
VVHFVRQADSCTLRGARDSQILIDGYMKLKRITEDFQVEEQIDLQPNGGPFALYRLTKQSLGTPEAIDAILRRWNLARDRVAYAGLKDKHALTRQYVTIQNGPRRSLSQTNLELEYLGQSDQPIHPRDIKGNRFVVVIRDLDAVEAAGATKSLALMSRDGLPNYFDNQRFGSLGQSGEFIARPWCLGDYERTLWLALADPNVHDRPDEHGQKQILRDHWGDWPRCKALLAPSPRRNIVMHLANHSGDFRRAIALMRQDLRSIWLAAFQSQLWNQVLAAFLRQACRPEQLLDRPIGRRDLPFFTQLDDAQRRQLFAVSLPLPSARLHLEEGALKTIYDTVLAAEGLELRQIRVKYPRDSFFSKGERAALFQPAELEHAVAADEIYPDQRKLMLQFILPRGSYATILVKRIAGLAADELAEE